MNFVCIVFNAGGPMFVNLTDIHKSYPFPLDGVYYNFVLKQRKGIYSIENIAPERQGEMKSFYTTFKIFTLEHI